MNTTQELTLRSLMQVEFFRIVLPPITEHLGYSDAQIVDALVRITKLHGAMLSVKGPEKLRRLFESKGEEGGVNHHDLRQQIVCAATKLESYIPPEPKNISAGNHQPESRMMMLAQEAHGNGTGNNTHVLAAQIIKNASWAYVLKIAGSNGATQALIAERLLNYIWDQLHQESFVDELCRRHTIRRDDLLAVRTSLQRLVNLEADRIWLILQTAFTDERGQGIDAEKVKKVLHNHKH